MGNFLLLVGLLGDSVRGVVAVGPGCAVDVQEVEVGGGAGGGNVYVGVEHALLVAVHLLLLSHNQGGAVNAVVVDGAGLYVVIALGGVGAIVEQIGHGLNGNILSIPVQGVGLVGDGVVLGNIGDKEGTAVGDMVGVAAVHIVLVGVVKVVAELAALGGVVAAAQGQGDAVVEHGGEVRSLLLQGVLQGVVVDSLDSYAVNIALTVNVVAHAHNIADEQGLKACLGVQHMLHTGNPVVSDNVAHLAALAVHPLHALTDVESVGQAVLGNIIALGQCKKLAVLAVVVQEAVHAADGVGSVARAAGVHHVIGGGHLTEGQVQAVLELIAVRGQVLGSCRTVLAGAALLVEQLLQGVAVLGLQNLVGDKGVLITSVVRAPAVGGN